MAGEPELRPHQCNGTALQFCGGASADHGDQPVCRTSQPRLWRYIFLQHTPNCSPSHFQANAKTHSDLGAVRTRCSHINSLLYKSGQKAFNLPHQ